MTYDPQNHHRRSIRLQGYDYSQAGAYFVTIVAWQRETLFGELVNGEMRLNQSGRIVQRAWDVLPRHYPHVELDAFCVMPNHVHGIILLTDGDGRGGSGLSGKKPMPVGETRPKRHGLSEVVRAFKSYSAQRINVLRKLKGILVWQRNYYEHIIRSNEDYVRISQYVRDNPLNWETDAEYVTGLKIYNKLNQ